MSWAGIAMYGALAVGAPLGAVLGQGRLRLRRGIGDRRATAGPAAGASRSAGLPVARRRRRVGLPRRGRPDLAAGARVWCWPRAGSAQSRPSLALALRRGMGWGGAGLALTGFGADVHRLAPVLRWPAGPPRRHPGRRRVPGDRGLCGLTLIALAWSPLAGIPGHGADRPRLLDGVPLLGVEVVRRVPAESRGVALGVYLACFDLGLGAAGPIMGVLAAGHGLPSAFLGAACAALVSLALVWTTRVRLPPAGRAPGS